MKKRVLSVLICMVLVLGSLVWLTPDTSVEAASAVKLNKKKMTMYVGDTFILKLKNATGDVKFSSTDKKVAKVSAKGVVTAVAEGKATIKAKYNKKTYKCKITVKEDNRYITDRIQDPENPLPEGCGIYEIKLSGKAKDHVITDRLCYIMGEKCLILLDKDIDLPGDFVKNVDLIMTTLEEKIGLKFSDSNLFSTWQLDGPWVGIEYGKRIPIYINCDRVDGGYISYAFPTYCKILDYALISQKVWDSVPTYKDNAWRRSDYVNYETIAHELTHVLTLRYASLSSIMTEGSAEFYAKVVLEVLQDKNTDFKKCYEHRVEMDTFINTVEQEIKKSNMEAIFVDDYKDLSMMDRTDKYTLGCIICDYLYESYGANFMKDYINALAKANYTYEETWGSLSEENMKEHANIFKKLFGKKVFESIATYYNKQAKQ